MTAEKFIRRNTIIVGYLQEIAAQQEQLQGKGVLQLDNPRFRELLGTQERLLTALERLLDPLPAQAAA